MKWLRDKTVWGHLGVAFGLVLLLGVPGFIIATWTHGFAIGMYYGREVDQEQQKLVFNRTLKDPNVKLKDVGFRRLVPWKWKSSSQLADLIAAVVGATIALLLHIHIIG
jgi:hypothetical protein